MGAKQGEEAREGQGMGMRQGVGERVGGRGKGGGGSEVGAGVGRVNYELAAVFCFGGSELDWPSPPRYPFIESI